MYFFIFDLNSKMKRNYIYGIYILGSDPRYPFGLRIRFCER
jgi:hypothetical protein